MKGSKLNMLWSILLGGLLPLILALVCKSLIPDWQWVHVPFHSVFEVLGFFAGLSLAILLLLRQDRQKDTSCYVWVVSALIGMGVLDGFHASVSPGNAFVWLHSAAVLVGGFLFCMVWVPVHTEQSQAAWRLAAFVAAAAISLGVFSLVFPEALPLLMVDGHFTLTASTINVVAGIPFVVAAIFFLVRYWTNRQGEEILFAFFCFLNGSSALLFPLGGAWAFDWWLWHLLRMIAYLILLGYVFYIFADLTERQRMAEMEVKEAVNVLAASSGEILAATTQVASGTAETATAISETTTTVEEVRQAAQLSSQKAQGVAASAKSVAQASQTGQQGVEKTAAGMRHIRDQMDSIARSIVRLSEQGQSIGGIIASVTDLADQSNLLAVNAAIEAARAGEQGKSFAVVAQEIRSLAEQSKQATAQVRDILSDVQKATAAAVMATEQGSKAVDGGMKQSEQAGEAIRALAKSIEEAVQAAMQIVASSQQQVVGMDQIGVAMENINQAGAETAASMRQSETAARNLHELGQKLKQMVEQYKV